METNTTRRRTQAKLGGGRATSRRRPGSAAALTALGDPTRRAVFERLALGPRSVGDLAAGMSVSRPAVSQHLKVLKDAGLVIDTPAGTRRLYQLDPSGVATVRAYFDEFWTQALAAFKVAAERTEEP